MTPGECWNACEYDHQLVCTQNLVYGLLLHKKKDKRIMRAVEKGRATTLWQVGQSITPRRAKHNK